MYAVVGIWSMDESLRGAREGWLREKAVPQAVPRPGFVSGYWMSDPETGKGHTLAVFDGEGSAAAFKALVESQAGESARVGLTQDILALVEVDASVGPGVPAAAGRPRPPEPSGRMP